MKGLKKLIITVLAFLAISILGISLVPTYVHAEYDNENVSIEDDDYENYSEEYKKYLALSDEEKAPIEVIPEKYNVSVDEFWNKYYNIYPEKKSLNKMSLLKQATASSIPDRYCLSSKYNYSGNAGINIQAESQVGGTCWDFASIMTMQTSIARQSNSTTYPRLSNAHLDYLNSKYSSTPYSTKREIGTAGHFMNQYVFRLDGPVLEEDCEYITEDENAYINNKNGNVYVKVNGEKTKFISESKETMTDEMIEKTRKDCAAAMENLQPAYYVHEVIQFPSISKRVEDGEITYYDGINIKMTESEVLDVRNAIKEHIMEKGGVYSSIRTNSKFSAVKDLYDGSANPTSMVYHFDDSKPDGICGTHAITIVGWNDTISKENFKYKANGDEKTAPIHDGAWLCLNSWGSNWSEDGYFWISYDDACVESELTGIVSIDQNEPTYTTYTLSNQKTFTELKTVFNKFGSIKDVNDTAMTMKVSNETINNIDSLSLKECDITDSDMQEIFKKPFKNLKYLVLDSSKLTNITPILVNTNLESLTLNGDSEIKNRLDITGISQLSSLRRLELNNYSLIGYDKILQLSKLYYLKLDNDGIVRIDGISNLTGLCTLSLQKNSISDVGEIKNLSKLRELYLDENRIDDISDLDISNYSVFLIRDQQVVKTISDTTDNCSYPDVIKKAKQEDSEIYSSEGLALTNCTENSVGSGCVITENGKSASVEIKDGKAKGTKIIFKPILESIEVEYPEENNKILKVGESITILAKFLDNEYVYGDADRGDIDTTNAPKLKIRFGNGEERTANLMSAITNELRYTYTIQAGDSGILSIVSYKGKVYDYGGTAYSVGLRENTGNRVYADTNIPQLQSLNVVSPDAGSYKAGQEITIEAAFSENIYGTASQGAVTSSNAPKLEIKFGNGTGKPVTFKEVNGKKIKYKYTVVTGDTGKLQSSNYSGKVYSQAGTEVNVSNLTLGGNEIRVDTSYPRVQSMSIISPEDGKYKAGQVIKIEVAFHEYVYGGTNQTALTTSNAPELTIKIGDGSEKTATFESVNNEKITYKYTIEDGDNGEITVSNYEGNIYDKFGNVGTVTKVEMTANNVIADNEKPTVEIQAFSTNPTTANEIVYWIAFSENVVGFTQDDINIENGTIEKFTEGGKLYGIKVSNTGNCTQKVKVNAGVCTDEAGNPNLASEESVIVIKDSLEAEEVLLGDVNENGTIDISDIIAILRNIASETNLNVNQSWKLNDRKKLIADATQDGTINISDVVKLRRYIAATADEKVGNKWPKWKVLGTITLDEN